MLQVLEFLLFFLGREKEVAGFLKRLDLIGVREQRGKQIVKELTGKDAKSGM